MPERKNEDETEDEKRLNRPKMIVTQLISVFCIPLSPDRPVGTFSPAAPVQKHTDPGNHALMNVFADMEETFSRVNISLLFDQMHTSCQNTSIGYQAIKIETALYRASSVIQTIPNCSISAGPMHMV